MPISSINSCLTHPYFPWWYDFFFFYFICHFRGGSRISWKGGGGWRHSQAPPPLGHCPRDVIHPPKNWWHPHSWTFTSTHTPWTLQACVTSSTFQGGGGCMRGYRFFFFFFGGGGVIGPPPLRLSAIFVCLLICPGPCNNLDPLLKFLYETPPSECTPPPSESWIRAWGWSVPVTHTLHRFSVSGQVQGGWSPLSPPPGSATAS